MVNTTMHNGKRNNDKRNGNKRNDGKRNVETRHCLVSTTNNNIANKPTIGQNRFQNQGKNTLSSIIGSYKSVVSKNARNIHADFAWQTRFHDHIIRNDGSYNRIQTYIMKNPLQWANDKFNGTHS